MAKIKEVSSYNGTSWDTPVPIGANDANIDITSSTTNPTDTTSTSAGLVDSNVTVSAGDTAASAWTKFNRFRKRVQNAFGNFAGVTLRTAYNTSNTSTSVYTTGVINNYMSNVIGYTGTTEPSAGTVAAQLSSLNSNLNTKAASQNPVLIWTLGSNTSTTAGPRAELRRGGGTNNYALHIASTTADGTTMLNPLVDKTGQFCLGNLFFGGTAIAEPHKTYTFSYAPSVVIVSVYNNDQSTTIPVILWTNPCTISHFYLYGSVYSNAPVLKIDNKIFTNNTDAYLILIAMRQLS